MHIPVLQKEVLEYLDPKPNQNFVDCTFGQGGHTSLILEHNKPNGKVLGIDFDLSAYRDVFPSGENIPIGIKQRLILVRDNFVNLKEIVARENFGPVSGILLDLGMSSWHLEMSGRGFTFQKDETLDMRFDRVGECTAENIVNDWPENDIERILRDYGGERFAKRIARKIVIIRKQKPVKTTWQLKEIIKQATPSWYHHKRIHHATRTFQALRIAVNDELNSLKRVLPVAWEILQPRGRLVVISFHSLEDRIAKIFFKESGGEIITKKPVTPNEEEIKLNPRSRSAKLRAGIKTDIKK